MSGGGKTVSATELSPVALSEAARIANTFVAPSKTFTDLRRNPSWFVPWLLLSIVSLGIAYLAGQKVGWEQLSENQLRLSPKRAEQIERLDPPAKARAQATSATFTKAIAYGFPIIRLLSFVVIAAVLLFSFKFGAGVELNFNTALAVVSYASLPELIRGLLVIVFLLAGIVTPESFVLQNPIGSNLAVFATPGTVAWTLGSYLDVFMFWVLALAGIGFSCVSRMKRSTSLAVVFGWYALIMLIGVGAAALTS